MKADFGVVGKIARYIVWMRYLDWKLDRERAHWPARHIMPSQETESELWPHQVGQLLEPLRP